jgi:DNA-binding NtrC family response regulator
MPNRILLIEDDPAAGAAFEQVLRDTGYEVRLVTRGDDGLGEASRERFDVVITDFKLPGLSGLELISRLHTLCPRLPIIMITAHGTMETAIEATKQGAFDYLVKPFEVEELLDRTASAIEQSRLTAETISLGEAPTAGVAIVGNSRPMQELYKQIGRVAGTSVTVLIRGETGTGKELVARAICQHSQRAAQAFIAVNCAAIPETLLESELFGHERGAFTGAHARRIGRFEQATGGTLLLDEIGDLPPNTQAKLLRVIQERSIQRLGGNEVIPVDVRILAATHSDLESAIRSGEFREDLYYRLSVATIQLPPLRERQPDIPVLARYFMRRHAEELRVAEPAIQDDALDWLHRQLWPGNVRELENVIRRAMLVARQFAVSRSHLEQVQTEQRDALLANPGHAGFIKGLLARARHGDLSDAYDQMIHCLEPELFRQAMQLASDNQALVARWLGISRLRLRDKLRQHGLHPSQGLSKGPDSTSNSGSADDSKCS